ncbi:MAG TPA: tyrosine-type recombinase/integrase [Candidatus Dormibacteraeota bacterium]
MDSETQALLAALRRKLEATATPAVADLWPPFELAHAPPGAAPKLRSWRDHHQRWRDHVRPAFGAMSAGAAGPADVDAYRARRLGEGAALATVNREIALLRRLLRWSARRGLIAASGLHGQGMTAELIWRETNVRKTVIEDRPGARITLGELLAAADEELAAFVLLLHRTGMRRTEASLIQDERIDRDLGVVWVPSDETKGGEGGRMVPLSPDVLAALARVQRRPGNPFVFPSPRGRGRAVPVTPDAWTHRWQRLTRKLGLRAGPHEPPWLHDLRRSFCTLSRRRGEDTKAIMRITAHKTDIAFRRYDIFSLVDVLATKRRLEAARAAELAQYDRRPPARAEADPAPPAARVGNA